jgi:hypothetical protein
MNSADIVTLLNWDPIFRQFFQDAFSADNTLPSTPCLLVCNTDPSTKPDRHWIAIYVDEEGRGEYFDFGRSPERDSEDNMNEQAVQQETVTECYYIGSFCVFYMYCLFRCRGVDLNDIVNVLRTILLLMIRL